MKKILLLLFFVSVSATSLFSAEQDSTITQIFQLIYNEKYTEAHHKIVTYHSELGDFYSDILSIDLLWWKFVQSKQEREKQEDFNSFLEKFDTKYKNSSEQKLRQLIKNSYLIRYEFKRYNIIGAINTRSTIKKLLDEINAERMSFPENQKKLLSLYTTLFTYFDNLINPFFTKNRREIRANALKQVEKFMHDDNIIVKTLSLYFSGRIYSNIEKDDQKAIRCFQRLSKYYPENQFFKESLQKLEK